MRYIIYILISFGFWLLFTFNLSLPNIIVGLIISVLTVLLLGRYFVGNVTKLFQPQRYFWFVVYAFIFAWECLRANLDVAYRVLHPDLPIRPGIVKIKTNLKTDIARATLANSITMTPGTITVDIVGDDLFIHWINVSGNGPEEYGELISGRFEKYIKKIFE